ncbi:MAG: hypothetical protein A4E23_00504 [Methanomethylovorans sp. PtaU1.Bin073]|nr:MAG: hypothetical protein A4E23_00504 [Methanomethylovorans sp. PtaU1.Bin073]
MNNCTQENKTPLAPWCAACLGGYGRDSCPFVSQSNTNGTASFTLLLKDGSCITDLKHFQCAMNSGYLDKHDDESKMLCNVIGFVQYRKSGVWDVSVPVAEISAIFHGPLKFDQEDEEE